MSDPTTQPRLAISRLSKSYRRGRRSVMAVASVDLEVAPGELVVLLGPSGCGKTTTLRCVAGLEEPDSGTIAIGGRTVFGDGVRDVPPEGRGVGMVFQSYSLWPHLTVERNIEYPLRVRGLKEGRRAGWVKEAARVVQCEALLDRYPSELSGGQQQRVALARGLVARPELLLFDEPLSNLDARLRIDLRAEIGRLHEELGFAALYVTHDQEEAIVLGDRVVVIHDGHIEQQGTPEEVFRRPATSWMATFLGLANRTTEAPRGWDGAAELRVRPERCRLATSIAHGGVLPGEVTLGHGVVVRSTFSGLYTEHEVDLGWGRWIVRAGAEGRVEPGVSCVVLADRADVVAYDDSGGAVDAT